MYQYNARIVYVVDGDTVDALVDLGFGNFTKKRLRLYGIDTPERGKPGYNEAKQFVIDKVLNQDVIINTFKDKEEKYGRYLAEIYLAEDPTFINDQLVMLGLAKPYFGGKKDES